jgi:hypothetical protein
MSASSSSAASHQRKYRAKLTPEQKARNVELVSIRRKAAQAQNIQNPSPLMAESSPCS